MIHPFQSILSNDDGTLLFGVIRNMIQVYRLYNNGREIKLIGSWIDTLDKTSFIKETVLKEQKRQIAENVVKKIKSNDGQAVSTKNKEAKIPVPGPGAPPVYQYIRNLILSRDETLLIGCTDSDKAAVIFQLDLNNEENCLKLIKRQPYLKRPSAITISLNNQDLIVADKFGDVYSMTITDPTVNNMNNQEPILGHVSMLTSVAMSKDFSGKQYIITADRDEHIRISHYPQSFIIDKWLFGHKEFISTLCLPDWNMNWLFSGGGDNFICTWDWQKGELLSIFDFSELVKPLLTTFHLAPQRFQNEHNNLKEYSLVNLVTFNSLPYVSFFIEGTMVLFICKVDKLSGELTLKQSIEFPYNIVSLTSSPSLNQLCVSLDNRSSGKDNFIKFISERNENFIVDDVKSETIDEIIRATFLYNKDVAFDKDYNYPLYHIGQLKKHGEYFS